MEAIVCVERNRGHNFRETQHWTRDERKGNRNWQSFSHLMRAVQAIPLCRDSQGGKQSGKFFLLTFFTPPRSTIFSLLSHTNSSSERTWTFTFPFLPVMLFIPPILPFRISLCLSRLIFYLSQSSSLILIPNLPCPSLPFLLSHPLTIPSYLIPSEISQRGKIL